MKGDNEFEKFLDFVGVSASEFLSMSEFVRDDLMDTFYQSGFYTHREGTKELSGLFTNENEVN